MTGRVFRRSAVPDPPMAVRAHGSTIETADRADVPRCGRRRRRRQRRARPDVGRRGHGRASRSTRLSPMDRAFTTEAVEAYAAEVGAHLPLDGPAIYPVSGGSEAVETALKMARAYHLARGEPERWIVIARWGSYHGNTLGALDLSGRRPLRRPYEAWLGRFRHVSAAYPYRAGAAGRRCHRRALTKLAAELEPDARAGRAGHRGRVRRASRSWAPRSRPPSRPTATGRPSPRSAARHGVLLIADEVMTGFGRTGTWFGMRSLGRPAGHPRRRQGRHQRLLAVRLRGRQRRGPRPPSSAGGFVHGFTYSHHVVGAAVAARGPPHPRVRVARRGERGQGCRPETPARSSTRRPPQRRPDPRSRPARRASSSWPTARPGRRSRGPPDCTEAIVAEARVSAASCSTPGPATPTASTATRSSSARRS